MGLQSEPLHDEKRQSWGAIPRRDQNQQGEDGVAGLQRSIVLFSSVLVLLLVTWCGILTFAVRTEDQVGNPAPAEAATAVGSFEGVERQTGGGDDLDGRSAGRVLYAAPYLVMAGGAVLLAVIVIATLYLLNRVVKPLKELSRALYRMSHGHLEEPVPVDGLNQMGTIGDWINDLATDLQEVLLHIWNHTSQDLSLLNRIGAELGSGNGGNLLTAEMREDFDFVRRDIENMQAMVNAFHLYHVQIVDEKVMSEVRPQG